MAVSGDKMPFGRHHAMISAIILKLLSNRPKKDISAME
jgi:hypothetical protein